MDALERKGSAVSAINVTPMADIVIVLLIICMISTSALNRERVKDLPGARNAAEKKAGQDAVVISVLESETSLDESRFSTPEEMLPFLKVRLEALGAGHRDVLLKAKWQLPYAEVEKVEDVCRRAGVEEVALVTAPSLPPRRDAGETR